MFYTDKAMGYVRLHVVWAYRETQSETIFGNPPRCQPTPNVRSNRRYLTRLSPTYLNVLKRQGRTGYQQLYCLEKSKAKDSKVVSRRLRFLFDRSKRLTMTRLFVLKLTLEFNYKLISQRSGVAITRSKPLWRY